MTSTDLIKSFMLEHQKRAEKGEQFEAALIVCGRKGKYNPEDTVGMLSSLNKANRGVPISELINVMTNTDLFENVPS